MDSVEVFLARLVGIRASSCGCVLQYIEDYRVPTALPSAAQVPRPIYATLSRERNLVEAGKSAWLHSLATAGRGLPSEKKMTGCKVLQDVKCDRM